MFTSFNDHWLTNIYGLAVPTHVYSEGKTLTLYTRCGVYIFIGSRGTLTDVYTFSIGV